MAERYFEKDGKKVSYSTIKNLYGDKADSMIKSADLKEISTGTQNSEAQVTEANNQQKERIFTKDGKNVSYSTIQNLYGADKADDMIKKGGLKEVSLEKHEDFKGESKKYKDYIQNVEMDATKYGYIQPKEKKGIRTIQSNELFDLGETDAVRLLKDQYGKAGFEFSEAVPGMDYIDVTSPTKDPKTGKPATIRLSFDKMMGHDKEMNKFNDWMKVQSEGLSEDALQSTHEPPEYMTKYWEMQDATKLSKEVKADMASAAKEAIADQPMGGKKVAGIFGTKAGDAMTEAEEFYKNRRGMIQDEDGSVREVTEDDIRLKAEKLLIEKNEKDHIIEAHHDYFSTYWSDTEDLQEYMQARNTNRQLDLKKEEDLNIANIAKVRRLNDSTNVLSQNFQKHYDNLIARRDAGEQITQDEIDSLKAKGEEIQKRIALSDEVKEPFVELAKRGQKYDVAADYLDNVNGNIENLIKTLGSATTDLGSNVLWGAGSLLEAGTGIDAIKDLGEAGKDWAEEQRGRLQKRGSGYQGLTSLVEKGLVGVAENAPLLALGAATGGGTLAMAGVFGISGAVGKHYDMTQEDVDKQTDLTRMQQQLHDGILSQNEFNQKSPALIERYRTDQMIWAPLLYGVAESVTMIPEMMMLGGAFRGVSKGFGGSGSVFGRSFANKMASAMLGTTKGFAKAQSSEVAQEIFTQFGQNGVDMLLGKKGIQFTDGIDADFLIKTMGSTGTFQTAGNARALAAKISAGHPMTLDSDNELMQRNSQRMLNLSNSLKDIDSQIATEIDPQKIQALQSEKANIAGDLADESKNQEKLLNTVLNYSNMGPHGVDKLRDLSRQGSEIKIEADKIKANKALSKTRKDQLLGQLQTKYDNIESQKKQIVENNNTYQLENNNVVRGLENQAVENLREKHNGEIPNKKQIEKEASRIFDKDNNDTNIRKEQARTGIQNNVAKYESEGLINRINAIDPTQPIEKREFNTLKEAKEFMVKDMSKKGYATDSDRTIQAIQELEQNWDNSAASIFQPEVLQDGQRQLDPSTSTFNKHQTVVVNAKKAATDPSFAARGHDVFHGMLWKAFKSSGQGFQNLAEGLVTHIDSKKDAGTEWLADELTQLSPDDANYHEEVIAKIADGMRNGQIKITPDISKRIGNLIKQSSQALGIDTELMINDPADMFELIDSYNRNLKSSGRLSGAMKSAMEQGVAVDPKLQPKRQIEPDVRITKQYKQDKAFENKIQELYEQGKEYEITEAYRPRVERILEAEWKNYLEANNIRKGSQDYKLVVDEVLTGDRGVFDIVKDYKPGKVPVSGYIGSIMSKRGISEQVFRVVPDTAGMYKQAIDAETRQIADEVIEEIVEAKKDLLKEAIDVDPSILNKVVNAVTKTFGTKLGDITSPQFKKNLAKSFRTELHKVMKDMLGKRADYKDYLENNWENIWKALPQDIVNIRFKPLIEKVKTTEGKQARAKTKAGRRIFKKKKLTQKEFIDYFLGDKVGDSTKGTRKDTLAQAIAETLARDEVMDVLAIPEVAAKFEDINALLNLKLPKNWKAYVQEAIDGIDKSIAEINDPNNLFAGPPKAVVTGFLNGVKAAMKKGMSFVDAIIDSLSKTLRPWLKRNFSSEKAKSLEQEIVNDVKGTTVLTKAEKAAALKEVIKKMENIDPATDYNEANFMALKNDLANMSDQELKDLGINKNEIKKLKKTLKVKSKHVISGHDTQHEAATKKLADVAFKIADVLPEGVFDKLVGILGADRAFDFLGLQSRIVNVAKKSGNPTYHDKFYDKTGKPKFNTEGKNTPAELVEIWEDVPIDKAQPLNVMFATAKKAPKAPMLKEIIGILTKPGKVAVKWEAVQKAFNSDVNVANKKVANAMAKTLIWAYKNNKMSQDTLLALLKSNSELAGSFRSFGGIGGIFVESKAQTVTKGEHADSSSQTMDELFKFIISDKSNSPMSIEANKELENILNKDQVFGDKDVFDKIDDFNRRKLEKGEKQVGVPRTSTLGWDKFIKVLGKKAKQIKLFNKPDTNAYDVSISKEFQQELKKIKERKLARKNAKKENAKWTDFSRDEMRNMDKAKRMVEEWQQGNLPKRGITIMDFDETLAKTTENVLYTMPDGKKGKLTTKQFADKAAELTDAGAIFDYSQFEKVKGAKRGPMFEKAMDLATKYGTDQIHILTARPQSAMPAIQAFMKANGLEIKAENITGVEDGNPQAKRAFVLEKAAEGFNNFFFADDSEQNVEIIKETLKGIDVKNEAVVAKRNFKKDLNKEFSNIVAEGLVDSKGKPMTRHATINMAKAKSKGARRGGWFTNFWIPPSAEDFNGLLYSLLSSGPRGDKQKAFFKKALIDPFAKGIKDLNAFKQVLAKEFGALKKDYPNVTKILRKDSGISSYTNSHAVRVYNWLKSGYTIEDMDISQADANNLMNHVESNPDMKNFADELREITKIPEGYPPPKESWVVGNIDTDIMDIGFIKRPEFLQEFLNNKDKVFDKENLKKLEYKYGTNYVDALNDMIYRMKHGINKPMGSDKLVNKWQSWVNNSVGAIMFFNMRSAVLQLQSSVNFINWSDNNPLKAAKTIANQPQFWKDFSFIFNHPTLKQRRAGMDIDVNASEIAQRVSNSNDPVSSALNWLLQKGFIPTRMADSFAIAVGGASMYRNRINTYLDKGFTKTEAESKAWLDFQEISEATQQSARPDMISKQQAGPLGRLVLAFQVTPMQYARLMKRAGQDLVAGRGDMKTNISKIVYYGVVQNLMFNAMQKAAFALMFNSDEEDEDDKMSQKQKSKAISIMNGMADTILRGLGVGGAVVATVKNMVMEFLEQEKRGYRADHAYTLVEGLNISPPIGSKSRKIYNATQTWKFNRDIIKEMGPDIDNPIYEGVADLVSGGTNVPVDRVLQNINNVRHALDKQNAAWQRVALLLGWPSWYVGVPKREIDKAKKELKEKKAREKKFKTKIKKLNKAKK